MKKLLSLLLAAVLAVCSFSAVLAEPVSEPTKDGVGMSIDGFSTEDFDHNPYDSSIIKDYDLIVINYWATWCGPCVKELPHFQEMHEKYKDRVLIIGVIEETQGCNPDTAKAYLEEHELTFLNLRLDDKLEEVFNTFEGYSVLPQTIFVDNTGKIREHKASGYSSVTQLETTIIKWLKVLENSATAEPTSSPTSEPTSTAIPDRTAAFDVVVPENPVQPGSEFTMSVNIAGSYAAHILNLELDYDPSVLEIVKAENSAVFNTVESLKGYVLIDTDTFTDSIHVGYMLPYGPVTEEGELFTVTFKVKDDAAYGDYAFDLKIVDFMNDPAEGGGYDIDSVCNNASVTVGEAVTSTPTATPTAPATTEPPTVTPDPTATPTLEPTDAPDDPKTEAPIPNDGDIDGDGKLTVQDALAVMRNAMGLLEFTAEQAAHADIDGNGIIAVADALIIMRAAMEL